MELGERVVESRTPPPPPGAPSQEKVAQSSVQDSLRKTKGSKVLAPTQEWVHLKGRDVFRALNSEGKWGPTGRW